MLPLNLRPVTWDCAQSLVQMCVRGKRRQTGGYEFRLAETEEVMKDTLLGEEWRDINVTGILAFRRIRSGMA